MGGRYHYAERGEEKVRHATASLNMVQLSWDGRRVRQVVFEVKTIKLGPRLVSAPVMQVPPDGDYRDRH